MTLDQHYQLTAERQYQRDRLRPPAGVIWLVLSATPHDGEPKMSDRGHYISALTARLTALPLQQAGEWVPVDDEDNRDRDPGELVEQVGDRCPRCAPDCHCEHGAACNQEDCRACQRGCPCWVAWPQLN